MAEVISIQKSVQHNNGDSWELDNYPPFAQTDNAEEWLGVSEISLERAKELAFQLAGDEAYDYEDEINNAEDLYELQDALDNLKYYQRDNTYNSSWWGGVVDFGVLTEDGEGYGTGLVLLRLHRGGDPRGNYYEMKAFELDSFIEEFPPYFSRLSYYIKTDEGDLTLDSEDMEGYSLLVVEDETGTFEQDDYVKIDEVEDAFDMNGNSFFSFGGGVAVGSLIGAYIGYKVGRARGKRKGGTFDTEKKIYEKVKKKFAGGGNVSSIEKKVNELNRLIELANEKGISVVDSSSTWQSPMKYKPIRYSNGVLYVEYQELDLYKYNRTGVSNWVTKKDKVLKRNMQFDNPLNEIAKMYRKALKSDGIEFAGGGGVGEELMGGQPNSIKPSGYTLVKSKGREIIVTEDGGKTQERWVKSNGYSGYTLHYNGNQYEFVSSFAGGGSTYQGGGGIDELNYGERGKKGYIEDSIKSNKRIIDLMQKYLDTDLEENSEKALSNRNKVREDMNKLKAEVLHLQDEISTYQGGGGVETIKKGDKVIWKGNEYTFFKITENKIGGFVDKKYHLHSYKVGVDDAILDSLKGVSKRRYAGGGGVGEELPYPYQTQWESLLRDFGTHYVMLMFPSGANGYLNSRINGNYSDDAIRQSLKSMNSSKLYQGGGGVDDLKINSINKYDIAILFDNTNDKYDIEKEKIIYLLNKYSVVIDKTKYYNRIMKITHNMLYIKLDYSKNYKELLKELSKIENKYESVIDVVVFTEKYDGGRSIKEKDYFANGGGIDDLIKG
jgi:hypothetical protein